MMSQFETVGGNGCGVADLITVGIGVAVHALVVNDKGNQRHLCVPFCLLDVLRMKPRDAPYSAKEHDHSVSPVNGP